ncbi:MAG: hypothetical protein EBZ45_05970, partial [Actinobacteria bacterium]|nr:hypothetical protein [Actinomycetota bacterium]
MARELWSRSALELASNIASKEEETSTDVSQKYAKLSTFLEKYADEHYFPEEVMLMVDDALRKTAY